MQNKRHKKVTGAEILFESLLKNKVEIIFGYPGGAIMPIYDALTKYEKRIKHILTGHEQGAVHAAEGYARTKRQPGICFATSGPGATNFVTGIADAMMDSVPIICITGQVSRGAIGTEAFQETPIVEIVKPITKFAYQIKNANEIEEIIDKAYFIANSGRPGPVLIDIPKDVQLEIGVFKNKKISKKVLYKINKETVSIFLKLLKGSKKPLLLVGNGVKISGADKELIKFLNKTKIHTATTLHGRDSVNEDYTNNLGMLGMHGNLGANKAINQADLIIALGMRFDDRVTGDLKKFAKNAKIIHIDIDKKQIGKKLKTELGLVCDTKYFLEFVNQKVNFKLKNEWGNLKNESKREEWNKVVKKEIHNKTGPILMAEVINHINESTIKNKIIIPDVGQHQMTVSRYTKIKQNTKIFSSGGLGTMGFSLPASIGAYFANPQSKIISISGDGGFQMNIQELATIMRYKVPVKIFIFNNSYLGMVRQWQEMFYKNNQSFVSLENPDFVAIGKAYKIKSFKISKRSELSKKVSEALKFSGPVLIEVVCKKQENVFPIIPSGCGIDEMILE